MSNRVMSVVALVVVCSLAGCQSPYYADRGAAYGGIGGAGVGALVGAATHHPLAGALIGSGVGAASGALVGGALDDIDAKNRAQIAAHTGRNLPPGGVQVPDVLAMTRSGVDEELVVNHIRANGMAQPLQAGDLIALQQQGVSKNIITAMQTTPPRGAAVAQPMMVSPQPVYYYSAREVVYPAPSVGVAVGS